MKFLILLSISLLFFGISCQMNPNKENLNRTPTNEAESLVENKESIIKMRAFFYIAQDMINRFDTEVDRLYQIKKSQKKFNTNDLVKFREQQTELRLAWEFSDKISLSTDDEHRFSITPDIKNIKNLNDPSNLQFALTRPSTDLSRSSVLSEWLKYKDLRLKEIATDQARTPQAMDTLEPAADGRGVVTGFRFPQGTWALTFDDGPHPTHTREMYAVLNSNHVHGTFCWLTKNILLYPDIVSEAPRYGFSRASHSYDHAQLTKLNPQQLDYEITQAGTDFAKIIGERPTLFRCPYGDCGGNNSPIRELIAKNNMIHVAWNVDTLDWQDKNPTSIFERTRKQIEILGRGIILFHDIHPQSVEAVKLLIPYMKNKKYQIKPLKEIISTVREKPFESP